MGYIFSVTINTYFKRRILARPGLRETVVTGLKVCAQRFGARVYAYCVMPNHVHLLARTPVDVDFDDFIDRFKQETSLALRMELGTIPIWQPRYYDHALRRAESVPAVARYIWANPVRARLVREPEEWFGNGSLEWPGTVDAGPAMPGENAIVELE